MLARMDANMKSYQEKAETRHEEILDMREEIETNQTKTDAKVRRCYEEYRKDTTRAQITICDSEESLQPPRSVKQHQLQQGV